MATVLSQEDALVVVCDAIQRILDDRGTPIEEGTIGRETLLYGEAQDAPSLELDSLDALDLITVLEEKFNVEFPEGIEIERIHTVGDVVDVLVDAVGQ